MKALKKQNFEFKGQYLYNVVVTYASYKGDEELTTVYRYDDYVEACDMYKKKVRERADMLTLVDTSSIVGLYRTDGQLLMQMILKSVC